MADRRGAARLHRAGRFRLEVAPGFVALLAVLFYLDEGVGLLGWGLLACAAHELGHVAAVAALGGRVRLLRLSAVGAQLCLDGAHPLSYARELAAALAGPAASLLTARLAAKGGLFLLSGLSLGQGLFNLLPLSPLDGGRCVYLALSMWAGDRRAGQAVWLLSCVLAGLLLGAGLAAAAAFGNPTLLLTAAWLGALQLRRKGE